MHTTVESLTLWLEAAWPAGVLWFFAKATLLLLAALALNLALRGRAAAVRHLVWSAALAGLLLLPLLGMAVPGWSIPGLAWGGNAAVSADPAAAAAHVFAELDAPAPASLPDANLAPAAGMPPLPPEVASAVAAAVAPPRSAEAPLAASGWARWLLAVWAAGALGVLGWLAVGYLRMMRLVRGTVRVTEPEWLQRVSVLADALGIRRPVTLLHGDHGMMPVTCGIVWPVILIPPAAEEWSPERRRAVLLHELAHIRRQDCLTQLLAQLCCAVFWFHPVVWFAARQMRIERERACDDVVLRFGTRASDYAVFLLEVARGFRGSPLSAPAVVSMARPSQLEGRLLAVLDARRPRTVPSGRLYAVAAAAALGVVVPLAALEPSAEAGFGAEAAMAANPWSGEVPAMPFDDRLDDAEREPAPAEGTLADGEFAWRGRLSAGATLAVHNLSGNIRAVPAAGPQAEVRAQIHVRRGDLKDVQVEAVEHAGGVTLCVLYAAEREAGNRCTADGAERRNVDRQGTRADVHFTVSVPAGVALHARTLSGSIEGEGVPGDVDAVTLSGSVRISAAGAVQATTMSGTLDVAMGRTAWDGTLALRNMSGAIRVRLPAGASTEVQAQTMSGAISSDFPLQIRRRSAEGTLGAGGRRLELQTLSGSIRIEQEGAVRTATAEEPRGSRSERDRERAFEESFEESMSGLGEWIGQGVGRVVSTVMEEVGRAIGGAGGGHGSPRAMHDYPTPELIGILRDEPDAELRRIAAWRLSHRGAEAVAPLSRTLRSDADPAVREMAAWSLARIGDRDGVSALQEAVRRDADEEVRWSALLSLGELGTGALAPVLAEAAADRAPRIRQRAVWTMGSERRAADVAALRRALRDADPEVRRMAAWASGSVRDASLVGALAAALDDREAGVRKAALWALTRIDHASAREAVRQASRNDDAEVRRLALGSVRGDPWPWPWPWPIPRPRPAP
jgi:beta-lactamase regulating signal transducer with metallopeptidase domain